ncbi:MAG: ABC-type transport auxiliary lipoprotein family protein [Candidatus Dactylopiibacterium sp.]|nr:ABC-type transport auxiliary lipoprotein family protein [Candidatus Dactylopiibacterium sp.]
MIHPLAGAALTALMLSACSVLPQAAPPLTQHDLGGGFAPVVDAPLPLRAVEVTATPLAAGLAMQYREAARPTTRASYAFNRWAAPPAQLVAQAFARLLPLTPAATCRLDLQLDDVLLEIDADGRGEAVLNGRLRLSRNTEVLRAQLVAQRVPLPRVAPADYALAQREAVLRLAREAAQWSVATPACAAAS